jgi:hypothetical protein
MVSEALSSFAEESATADIEAALDSMELQYPQAELFDNQNPVYIFTETGWRVPTAAVSTYMVSPAQVSWLLIATSGGSCVDHTFSGSRSIGANSARHGAS